MVDKQESEVPVWQPTLMLLDVAFAHVGVVILAYQESCWVPLHAVVVDTVKSDKKTRVRAADDNFRRCQEIYCTLVALARAYHTVAMIAELPTGGSKSSAAAAAMARAAAVFACVAETMDVVVEITTPGDGKKALAGSKTASKEQMMRAAMRQFPALRQWFAAKRGDPSLPENKFEHVADAVGAFAAARGGTAEKLVVQLSQRGQP